MKNIRESQIEDVFEAFHSELLEEGLELVERQKAVKKHGVRFDLLFKDRNGKNVILELKRNAISRDDIGQAIQYAGIVQDSRVILAAPIIPTSVKNAFEHYGIEYLEYDLEEIEKLLFQLKDKSIAKAQLKNIEIPLNIIKEPLGKRKIVDGNVAFKVTYNDAEWRGLCSRNIADFNFKNRTWCKEQSTPNSKNCQSNLWLNNVIKKGVYPCADAGALANNDPNFYAGHYHGPKHNNEPIRVWNIKRGKIAVFTSRAPMEPESERFIFFIGQITRINEQIGPTGNFETYHCDPNSGLYFNKSNYPKYWDFYKNPNKPEKIGWNTGLIRYWSDKQVIALLESVQNNKKLPEYMKLKAKKLLLDN